MGQVTYGDGIAIGQLVYYAPCLLGSIYVIHKHGFKKSSGWVFLVAFCVVRIVGAAARLSTISKPNESNGAWTVSLVCSALGLSPLFMATLGILSRAYYSFLSSAKSNLFRVAMVPLVHGPAMVAVGLCIAGATNAPTAAKIYSETTLHIGYILYTLVLVLLTALTLAWMAMRKAGKGEGVLVLAIICALPLLWIRLIYSLLAIFSHLKTFSTVSGSTAAESSSLFMAVVEEMGVVVIYLATGLKIAVLPADPENTSTGRPGRGSGRGDFVLRRRGLFSLGATAIQEIRAARTDPEANPREKYEPEAYRNEQPPRPHSQQRYEQARRT